MCMQSTQWIICDLSRTDHNKYSACEYRRLHKYGEKFNASIQIMVKRVTSKTVVLLFLTIIQYNTWSVYTQLLLNTVSLRGYISQSYIWIIRLVQKQWAKGEKTHIMLHIIFWHPWFTSVKTIQGAQTLKKAWKNTQPKKKTSVHT